MKYETFQRNLAAANGGLEERGMKSGGETGLCYPFAVAIHTGKFEVVRENQGNIPASSIKLSGEKPLQAVLSPLLTQKNFPLDGVLVSGSSQGQGHVLSVVKIDPREGEKSHYQVVDSLTPGGATKCSTENEVVAAVTARFKDDKPVIPVRYVAVPSEKEVIRRSDTSHVEAVPLFEGACVTVPVINKSYKE